jgi:hypothetical protein
MRTMLIPMLLVLIDLAAAPVAVHAQTPYYGTWNVTIRSCDPGTRYLTPSCFLVEG